MPALILAAIDAALTTVERLLPLVNSLTRKGLVTPDEQRARYDRIQALRDPDLFSGPEWQVEP